MTTPSYDWFKSSVPDGANLEQQALAFLTAGGTLSWHMWATLDPDSRDAWQRAGARAQGATPAATPPPTQDEVARAAVEAMCDMGERRVKA